MYFATKIGVMRPWVDSVFRGRRPKSAIWAEDYKLAQGEEIRFIKRIGFDGESAVIVAVTNSHCYVRPDHLTLQSGTGTDIDLSKVEAVHLTGGLLSNVLVETTDNYYRLPATYRIRAVRIASTIADGAGLKRNGLDTFTDGWLGKATRHQTTIGIALGVLGGVIAALGVIGGALLSVTLPGLVIAGIGLGFYYLGQQRQRFNGIGITGSEVWTRPVDAGTDPSRPTE